ncbi:MAG: glutathione S-transferase family protein [Nevskiales bacterium]
MSEVRVIGSYLSPYVRKLLACLHLKGIAYEIDPIVPFFGNDEFSRLSPLRRIPVLVDGDVALSDSTVICEYLEERYPETSLYPKSPAERARARWLEEFADTRMGQVIIWQLYNEVTIKPHVWKQPTDEALVQRTLDSDLPEVLDYLESQLPAEGFLFGAVGIADIALSIFFRNATFARYTVDAARWPKTAGFVERVLALECLASLRPFEDKCLRTPIPKQREVLLQMGAPLTADTLGLVTPKRGIAGS